MSNNAADIGALVGQIAPGAGADPFLLLAVIDVETGGTFNPKSVGDHGTSFGLFQLHKGGALGSHTKEWAFDPTNSITDGASRLRGVTTGAGAAAVQRPADPAGYARKVDSSLKKIKAAAAKLQTSSAAAAPFKNAPERAQVATIAAKWHLAHTDGDRSPNAGYGAPNSDHSTKKPKRWADDYSGSAANMRGFEHEVRSQFPHLTVLGAGHAYSTGPNVHVAGDSKALTGSGPTDVVFVTPIIAGSTLEKAVAGALSKGVGKIADAATGAAGAVASTIGDTVTSAASLVGRYVFTTVLVVLGGVLIVNGAQSAVGTARTGNE